MAQEAAPSGPGGLLRDRRLLGLLVAVCVMLLVVGSVIGFSGAYFTSTSGSPGNEFAAGHVGLQLTVKGEIVDGKGMVPGDIRTGNQTVTNTAHRGRLVLQAQNLDQTRPLSQVLLIKVERTSPTPTVVVFDGTLVGLGSLSLGTIDKDESRGYRFTVTWPPAQNSPDLVGSSTSLVFDWQLASVP